MLTAVPPINAKAARAATRSVALQNPDLVNPDGTLKPVDASSARGQAVRQQWVQSYAANGGKAQVTHPPQRQAQISAARSAARQLPDKPPAQALVRCLVPGANRPAVAPPPGSTAKHPCQPGSKTCKPLTGTLQCAHGRKPSGGLLEVVPAEAGDKISLACGASACGKPPVWSITGHTHSEKTGSKTAFNAERWLMRAVLGSHWAATVTPKTYRVNVGTDCGTRSAEYTLRAFPSDRFSLVLNATEWAGMKSKVDYALDVVLGAYLVKPSFECLVGKLDVSAGWEEDPSSHLAFYAWKATVSFDPLIGGSVKVPFGPLAAIPQRLKKYGDAYFFVAFSGGVGVSGDWGRTAPKKIWGNLKATGRIGGKIGGSLFLVGKSVIVMEVVGSSGIALEAAPDLDNYDKPSLVVEGKWEGLKAEITVTAARGVIEFKQEFTVCEARPIMEKRVYALPVLG